MLVVKKVQKNIETKINVTRMGKVVFEYFFIRKSMYCNHRIIFLYILQTIKHMTNMSLAYKKKRKHDSIYIF